MSSSNPERLADWRVQTLRTTVFVDSPVDPADFLNWEGLIGEQPENSKSQPRLGTLEESGPYKDGLFSVAFGSNRVDLKYSAPLNVTDLASTETIPNVGPYLEAMEWYGPLMKTWLNSCPPITRLAFGPELVIPVDSHKEGYQVLDSLLPFVKVDPESREFGYSINRRRASESGIPGLEINRLSRWAVLEFATKLIDSSSKKQHDISPSLYCVRAVLDINSVAEFEGELPEDKRETLFDELVNFASEIAQEGDVP